MLSEGTVAVKAMTGGGQNRALKHVMCAAVFSFLSELFPVVSRWMRHPKLLLIMASFCNLRRKEEEDLTIESFAVCRWWSWKFKKMLDLGPVKQEHNIIYWMGQNQRKEEKRGRKKAAPDPETPTSARSISRTVKLQRHAGWLWQVWQTSSL